MEDCQLNDEFNVMATSLVAADNILDPGMDLASHVDASVVNEGIEHMEFYVQQPDGSKVRISFLPNGDILDGAHIEDLDYASSDLPKSEAASGKVQGIQISDGHIYFIETLPQEPSKDPTNDVLLFLQVKEDEAVKAGEKPQVESARKAKKGSVEIIGADLPIEMKLEVLETLLPPREKRNAAKAKKEEGGQTYNCDMCSATFQKAEQFYGHSWLHSKERRLRCGICNDGKIFTAHSKLMKHERRCHTVVREHVCFPCDKHFERASQLDYHMRRIHLDEKTHQCTICKKAFFKHSDLKNHINIHLGLNANVCHSCGKKFNHISNLNRHMRTHSDCKPYPCKQCGRRFSQPGGLTNHMQSHESPRNISCPVCNKVFKSTYTMLRHVGLLHKNHDLDQIKQVAQVAPAKSAARTRNFYCKVCGEMFPFVVLLKKHESLHKEEVNFHCKSCQETYDSPQSLETHACVSATQRAHIAQYAANELERVELNSQLQSLLGAEQDDADEIIIYVTEEGQNQPTQVHIKPMPQTVTSEQDETLVYDKLVEESLTLMNPAAPSPLLNNDNFLAGDDTFKDSIDPMSLFETSTKLDVPPVKPPKTYTCEECKKTFTKVSNYKQHMGTHFVHRRQYTCPTCGFTFAWKSTMMKHMSKHDTKPKQKYSCELCDRQYTYQTQVQDHIKRDHWKQKSHSCSFCPKTFFKRYDLKVHLRVHTKEKPYMCNKCGKSFHHVSHIIRHEWTHTDVKPYGCPCGKFFTQSSSLKVHRASGRCHVNSLDAINVKKSEDFSLPDLDDNTLLASFDIN